jgi:hypothetical protein
MLESFDEELLQNQKSSVTRHISLQLPRISQQSARLNKKKKKKLGEWVLLQKSQA